MRVAERTAIVIPCRNESAAITKLVRAAMEHVETVVVIDDGSSDDTSARAARCGAVVLRHPESKGKGAALKAGLTHAREVGCTWALCMDGDGQHAPADISKFLAQRRATPALHIGNRMANPKGMPWLRRFVNWWMSARISALTGVELPDTQCGFRLVHLGAWSGFELSATGFDYESEMLVEWVRAGLPVSFVPVQVIYSNEQSKISPVRDTIRWFAWWRGTRRGVAAKQAKAPAYANTARL
ncbi:MAG TPA: glycosyltransferase family 2 protein [Methylomirabilota bacterium]|nr:glycosyltransferase family 2 protein [Methylomirabilota bacterium]